MNTLRSKYFLLGACTAICASAAAYLLAANRHEAAKTFYLDDSIVVCLEGKGEHCLVVDMFGNPLAGESIETVSESGPALAKTDSQGRAMAPSYSHGAYLHIDGQRIPLSEFSLTIIIRKPKQ